MMNKKVWFLVAIGFIIAGAVHHFFVKNDARFLRFESKIFIGENEISVSVADTPEEREQGLSGALNLPKNTGKLFIFQALEQPGFWMKDMNFAIDIIWISDNWEVVGVSSNIAPETYPKAYYPPKDIQYVLEVNAGYAQANGIEIGDTLRFEK